MADFDVDALINELGISAGGPPPVAANPAPAQVPPPAAAAPAAAAPASYAAPAPAPAPSSGDVMADVDSLMSSLGLTQPLNAPPTRSAGPGAMAGPGVACAGPGAMRGGACAGPGAMACAGPGAMRGGAMAGPGVACAGPGAMRGGACAGPGAMACAGPGAMRGGACAGPGAMRGGACAGPGAMACAGPGAMRGGACAGPGAMACAGPGAMRGGACAGPGAMRGGAMAGPGGMACAGPGAMPFNPAQQTPSGQKLKFSGPPCSVCGEPIIGRVFAVGDKKYHPQCFQCAHCHRQILETEEFMEEKGDVYCQDCFYDLFGERCYGCKQPILDKCIRFMDRAYHPEHFACAECGTSLLGVEYKDDEGDPLCMKCKSIRIKIRETKNELCALCKKPIMGEYIILNGQKIHPEHYRCESCGCDFMGGNCKEHNGKNYCYECYDKLVKNVCAGCGKPIIGRSLTALQRTWHPECLCCTVCGETFVQGRYFEHDGKAYCQFHYYKMFGKICPRCQKVVEDDGISAIGQIWHPACFTCHGCSKPLKGAVYDYESKPLCKSCFGKLPKAVRQALVDKMEARKKFEKEEMKRKKAEMKAQAKAADAAAKARQH